MRFVIAFTAVVLCGAAAYYAGWRHGLAAGPDASQQAHVPSAPPAQAPAQQPLIPLPPPDLRQSAPEQGITSDYDVLKREVTTLPIAGLHSDQVQDTFNQSRGNGERRHEATDILAPRGTPVLAVADGTIVKLFLSKPGGITIYEFDPRNVYCFYYAHLDRYAPGLTEGMRVTHGQVIGYVGTTGNAGNTPHLHLAISRLTQDQHWWQSTPINPYPLLMNLFQ